MKPILLTLWPWHLDYPVFRWNLDRFKDYFASVWIGFSNHHVEDQDLRNFIRVSLPYANFVDIKHLGSDWRDDGVNEILDCIKTNEPILFIEEDFLIKDSSFFDKILTDHDFIYFKEGDRIHPAFAIVKRELIEKTHKDFSAYPPGDHFYRFFNELPEGVNIDTLGVSKASVKNPTGDYYHMNGLSQNYMSFKYGDPFYQPINFLYYNALSLKFPNQHPLFYQMEQQIERIYGHTQHHTFLDNFFPL